MFVRMHVLMWARFCYFIFGKMVTQTEYDLAVNRINYHCRGMNKLFLVVTRLAECVMLLSESLYRLSIIFTTVE